jgi:hypothetical protein
MSKDKIDLSDDVVISITQGKITKVEWRSGKVTIIKDHSKKKCLKCKKEINRVKDIIQLKGYCRSCYPKVEFNIPGIIEGLSANYTWDFPVEQTAYEDYVGAYSGNLGGRNFGIGDIVLYHPKRNDKGEKIKAPIEGKVIDIHQYSSSGGSVEFIAKVDFGKPYGEKFLYGSSLEPLTNEHVSFPGIKETSEMKNISIAFDPMKSRHKEIFKNPIARAIWMDYRRCHIVDDNALDVLSEDALKISSLLEEIPLARDRVALFFKKMMRLNISEEDAVFMVPYLTGEKIATYKVKLEKAVSK